MKSILERLFGIAEEQQVTPPQPQPQPQGTPALQYLVIANRSEEPIATFDRLIDAERHAEATARRLRGCPVTVARVLS